MAPWQPQHPRLCPVLPGQGPRAHARLVAATQLKPDVGTPELPAGRVRVRLEADGSVVEADEDSVQRVSPAFGLCRGWQGAGSPVRSTRHGAGCDHGGRRPAGGTARAR